MCCDGGSETCSANSARGNEVHIDSLTAHSCFCFLEKSLPGPIQKGHIKEHFHNTARTEWEAI